MTTTQPEISETMNVKGHRRCVTVVSPQVYQYFKIPDGLDLEDISVVKEWIVRNEVLNIHFVDSNKDSIFIQPHYTDYYADDDYEERIEDIDEAGQEDMYEDEDQSDEEEEDESSDDDDDVKNLGVIEWEWEGTTYYLNEDTNEIYDESAAEQDDPKPIGMRYLEKEPVRGIRVKFFNKKTGEVDLEFWKPTFKPTTPPPPETKESLLQQIEDERPDVIKNCYDFKHDLQIDTSKVLYQYFTKEHIEDMWGVKFTQEKWEQFVEDKQNQFAEQMSNEMEESREYYEDPLIEKSEYFIDEEED